MGIQRLRNVLRRTSDAWRREGLPGLVRGASRNLSDIILLRNEAIWYRFDLTRCRIPDWHLPDGFILEKAGIEKVRSLAIREGIGWLDEREDRCAMEENHPILLLERGEDAVGYIKAAWNRVYISDYQKDFPLDPRTAFIYDTYISKECRGKNLSSILIVAMLGELKEGGFRRVFCHIPSWNIASIRNYRRCGFEELFPLKFTRVAGIRFYSHPMPILEGKAVDS